MPPDLPITADSGNSANWCMLRAHYPATQAPPQSCSTSQFPHVPGTPSGNSCPASDPKPHSTPAPRPAPRDGRSEAAWKEMEADRKTLYERTQEVLIYCRVSRRGLRVKGCMAATGACVRISGPGPMD